jgi:hypothetical protein
MAQNLDKYVVNYKPGTVAPDYSDKDIESIELHGTNLEDEVEWGRFRDRKVKITIEIKDAKKTRNQRGESRPVKNERPRD